MNIILSNNGNETCPICADYFGSTDEDKAWTHVGGEKHEGIHKKCWRTWLQLKNACPMCRKPINLSSLYLPFKERIAQYIRPLQVNSLVIAATAVGATAGGLVTNSITGGPLIPTVIATCISLAATLLPMVQNSEIDVRRIAFGAVLGGAGAAIGVGLGIAAKDLIHRELDSVFFPLSLSDFLPLRSVPPQVEPLVLPVVNGLIEIIGGLTGGALAIVGMVIGAIRLRSN